ncbi:MAG TPA: sialate O-acetylesterase [Polyangiaceae bacterium]|nr:sialate O-acetylesterase [Polyangiaceae bacterium]
MTHQTRSFLLPLSVLITLAACSGTNDPLPDATGSGGAGAGGTSASGGASGTGGALGAGGLLGAGGALGTGGATLGAGGGVGAGGAPAAGGADASGGASGEPEFHIYLAVGQSNMQGAAHVPQAPAMAPFHERVQILQSETCPSSDNNPHPYGEWREMFVPIVMCKEGTRPLPGGGPEVAIGLGPADSFAVAMAEASGPNVTIGIVGAAHGDTNIDQHLPSCTSNCLPSWANNTINGAPKINGQVTPFTWVVDLAKKAQATGEIKGIIFHQGENDAGETSWPGKVNEYATALRTELGLNAADVPFIAGELPYTGGSANSHNPLVRQIPDVVENGHYVSAGPMENGTVLGDRGDGIHWSTDSVIEMGKRYAAKMLEAQGK